MANSNFQEARELTMEFVDKLTSAWSEDERAEVVKTLNGIFFKRTVFAHPEVDRRLAREIREAHRSGTCGGGDCSCVAKYEALRQRYLAATTLGNS